MTELGHTTFALLRKLRDVNGNLVEHSRGGFVVRPWNGGAGYWYPTWAVRQATRDGYITDAHINERGLSALQEAKRR